MLEITWQTLACGLLLTVLWLADMESDCQSHLLSL